MQVNLLCSRKLLESEILRYDFPFVVLRRYQEALVELLALALVVDIAGSGDHDTRLLTHGLTGHWLGVVALVDEGGGGQSLVVLLDGSGVAHAVAVPQQHSSGMYSRASLWRALSTVS